MNWTKEFAGALGLLVFVVSSFVLAGAIAA